MPSTYSPCMNCNRVNRVNLSGNLKSRPVCGSCKAELPIQEWVNMTNATGLNSLIQTSPLPIVVDFWAPWCQPCKAFAPVFDQASRNFADQAVFVKIDTQAYPLAADSHQIRGVPTLILFHRGTELDRVSGAMPLDSFSRWISNHITAAAA